MSVGIDTSIALRLLIGEPADQSEVAREFLATAPTPVAISDLVVGETYFALRHHYGVPHAEAVRVLLALLSDPDVSAPGVSRAVLSAEGASRVSKSLPGLVDRLIHADYRRDDLPLITFDRALGRLERVRVLE